MMMMMTTSAKKLVKMARKWQKLAALGKRKTRMITYGRKEEEGEKEAGSCRGHFVVYSEDEKRFTIPLSYLKQGVLRELLKRSEEEFGLPADGPIRLPCDRVLMEYIISVMRNGISRELEEALLMSSYSCLKLKSQNPWTNTQYQSPLLVY